MKAYTFAAIDIGSNAVRFLINNIEDNNGKPDFKKVAFLRVPIRLGEDVFTRNIISQDKKERLIHAIQGFSHIMKAYNVDSYRACATSAMRDTANGKEITDSILKECDINIEIITGREEADLICQASDLKHILNKNRNYLYVDVGGGSTEVVVYGNQKKITSHSFQLGTVRMIVDAVKEDEKKLFKKWLKEVYETYRPAGIIASGGNINKIHKLIGKRENELLSYTEIKNLYDSLKDLSYEKRILDFKLNTYRADVIIPALKIFKKVCKICELEDIYVPKVGLVDGIVHSLYYKMNNE